MSKLIPLTRGKSAIVDDEDYQILSQFTWYLHVARGKHYAARNRIGQNGAMLMHRQILSPKSGMDIDHVNGNGLDNRRYNLRICTRSENMRNSGIRRNNTSGFKGVSFHRPNGTWMARIRPVKGQRKNLGYFKTPELAGLAYLNAAKEMHGEFAKV